MGFYLYDPCSPCCRTPPPPSLETQDTLCGCDSVYQCWEFAIAGVTDGLGSCDDCSDWNTTFQWDVTEATHSSTSCGSLEKPIANGCGRPANSAFPAEGERFYRVGMFESSGIQRINVTAWFRNAAGENAQFSFFMSAAECLDENSVPYQSHTVAYCDNSGATCIATPIGCPP